ncbi:hypothetical protein Tco_0173883 [Tanacetum coccineum]
MHRREIHLDVVGISRCIFGMGRLCFMVGFERVSLLLHGILGSKDDSGDNRDGGGDRGMGEEAYLAMSALVDVVIGGGGGGVAVELSVSNCLIFSAEGTGSIAGSVVESVGARCSSSSFKMNPMNSSGHPLDEAWGNVGLPNGVRVLVEEGGNVYPGIFEVQGKRGKANPQRILKKCLCSKQEIVFQDTQTDCIQDTAQKMKLKRLKASIATMTRQTDAEQRRPTIKKLEVKQVEFKLGEDCWEIQSLCRDSDQEELSSFEIVPNSKKMSEAEPIPPASSVTTLLDDWSIEIDADHVDLGQDGLGVFDWSEEADNAPIALALMATSSTDSSNSKVPYCSKCSKSYKKLLENYQTERDNFQRARSEILGYQMSLESLEVMLKTHEKNEYAWGDKYEQMEYDLKIRDLKLEEKQKELDQVLKERDDFKVKLEKWTNASVLQNEVLNKQRYLSDKSCIGFGVESSSGMESDNSSGDETLTDHLYENFKREKAYKAVPPPTGTIIPPRANVSFTGIDELAIRNKVNNQEKIKSSQPEIDRNKVIIEDWVDSDDEETVLNSSETQKKTVLNSENSETSFKNRSPSSQNSVGQGSRKKGLGNNGGKLCFVCYSPNHLIKDCNLHERNFKQTQTHKPKRMQGSRDTRPVWNNINRVNHSNFSGNSRYPHQKRSFIPSAVLTREGLKSTARPKYCNCSFSLRPKMTQTVPSKRTANVFYQGTARPRVPQAVLSRSTGRPYYPRMDNRRPSISSYSPSSRSSTTRTPYRTQRPKKIVKSIWVKKGSTVESQAVLPQNVSIKRSAMITSKQTWRQNRGYLDSVNRDNGSYILKQFEYGNPEEDLKDYAIIDSGCSGSMTGDKNKLSDFKDYKG